MKEKDPIRFDVAKEYHKRFKREYASTIGDMCDEIVKTLAQISKDQNQDENLKEDIQKAKHYEYIDIHRDGKVIKQRRLVGSDKELLAPNGKKSNLSKEHHKLVRTEEFKKWFGDWENDHDNSSKVVDENGEPLVVYHGSEDNFDLFNAAKIGSRTKVAKIGFYFSDDYENSLRYAKNKKENVMPFFLNIRKLWDEDFKGKGYGGQDGNLMNKKIEEITNGVNWKAGYWKGFLAKNVIDTADENYKKIQNTYVAFYPEQILKIKNVVK